MLRLQFNTFLEEAHEAIGLQQLGHAFAGVAAHFGYEHCVVLDTAKFDQGMGASIVFTGKSRTELATFADRNAFREHPMTHHARRTNAPFFVEQVRQHEAIARDDWSNSIPPEIRSGDTLVLPVHRDGDLVLICGCNGNAPDTSPLARAALHTAAHVVYDRIEALGARSTALVPLTSREAECMRWMSLGKNDGEIARIVGISTRTVRFHLRNAKEKLGAATRVEAIAILADGARNAG